MTAFMFSLKFHQANNMVDILSWRQGVGSLNINMFSGEISIPDIKHLQARAPEAMRASQVDEKAAAAAAKLSEGCCCIS